MKVLDHGLVLVFAEEADGFDFFVHACIPEWGIKLARTASPANRDQAVICAAGFVATCEISKCCFGVTVSLRH
ncbi:MAG: hypothetical protein Q8O70_04835, partial [Burkholderiales bacterium]|nr:hypothetical protein [Burkholderiales bacterium]